jgi:hypothetical protein
MRTLPRRVALALVLSVSVIASACGDDQVKAIATNVDRIANIIRDAREVRDELFAAGLIDRDEAFKTTQALVKVNNSLKTFRDKASKYKVVDAAVKVEAHKLAEDILTGVDELLANGTFGVKSPQAQEKYRAVVGTIRQFVLALVEQINRLKSTTAMTDGTQAIQYAAITPLTFLPLLLLGFRKIADYVAEERARTGLTAEQIYEGAGQQIDANAIALVDDLAKYAPETE